jgi:hypothetical protein
MSAKSLLKKHCLALPERPIVDYKVISQLRFGREPFGDWVLTAIAASRIQTSQR